MRLEAATQRGDASMGPRRKASENWRNAAVDFPCPMLQWGRGAKPRKIATAWKSILSACSFNGAEAQSLGKYTHARSASPALCCFNGAEAQSLGKWLPHHILIG